MDRVNPGGSMVSEMVMCMEACVAPGRVVAVIGDNMSGKSEFIRRAMMYRSSIHLSCIHCTAVDAADAVLDSPEPERLLSDLSSGVGARLRVVRGDDDEPRLVAEIDGRVVEVTWPVARAACMAARLLLAALYPLDVVSVDYADAALSERLFRVVARYAARAARSGATVLLVLYCGKSLDVVAEAARAEGAEAYVAELSGGRVATCREIAARRGAPGAPEASP